MSEIIIVTALALLYGVGNLIWYILYTTVTRSYQKENKRLRERLAFYQDFLDDIKEEALNLDISTMDTIKPNWREEIVTFKIVEANKNNIGTLEDRWWEYL